MPRRRCVGCGRVAAKSQLVRIAAAPSSPGAVRQAVCDRDGTMPGRGAYLCAVANAPAEPARECLVQALRGGSIARTLRAQVAVDPKLVESVSR